MLRSVTSFLATFACQIKKCIKNMCKSEKETPVIPVPPAEPPVRVPIPGSKKAPLKADPKAGK